MLKRIFIATTLLLLAALIAPPLFSQDITGTVQGRVSDSTGAVIPNAQVELTNESTNSTVTRTTDGGGLFIFNLVPPGRYTVRASLQGFRTASLTGLDVEVNKSVRADINLAVGAVNESIEVSAAAARIDTVTAQLSTSASAKLITELPSASRNVLKFAELAPGVTITNNTSQVLNIEGSGAQVNGNRSGRNVFYLDGSDNTASFRNTALQFPNPEAVQEVNIGTSNTSAEFGKQPGGVFNIITKSGTNQFHGSGFYFWTDSAFDANSWARNRSGSAKAPAELQQTGGTLGGPILRDKLFFFGSYMHYRDQDAGFQNTIRFPTQAMYQGDFSQFPSQLYDPATSNPIPGNRIPASMLDPVARRFTTLIPTVPNFDDRYSWAFVSPVRNNEILGKGDYILSNAHSLMASYFRTFGDQQLANTAANGNVPAWGPQVNDSSQHTGSARHTWTLSPNTLVQSRFAIAKHVADRTNVNIGQNLADFGAVWPDSQAGARKYLPRIAVSQAFTGHLGFLSLFDQNNFRFGSTVSHVRGKHNLRFGGEAQRDTVRQFNDHDGANFNFDGRSSSLNRGQNVFGYAMADFMMGRVASFSTSGILDYNLSNWAYFFFFQDEWRITRKLTLTPGLRYELYAPVRESNNKASAFFFGHRSNQFSNAPLHMAFLGDQGIPDGFTAQDRNNFAPRLGLAYDVGGNGKTVIRGGFGVYYMYNPMQIRMWNAEGNPWRPSAQGGEALLRDPWNTSRTVVYTRPPTPFNPDPNVFVYPPRLNNVVGFNSEFVTPYSLQWNISAARDFGGKVNVEAAYVGNRGKHLLQMLPGNYPAFAPGATLGNAENRRPIAGYSHVSIIHSRGLSWYDAFQLSADTRLFKGLTSRVTYVYQGNFTINNADPTGNSNQQTTSPLNWDLDKGPEGARQVFRAFYIYDIPFLAKPKSLLAKIAGSWQVSGMFYANSGSALNVDLGEDRNLDLNTPDRPNINGPIRYTPGSADTRAAAWIADTSVFVPPVVGQFGTLSRNAVRGPGSWGTDLSLLKNFRFFEGKTIQFRAEAYNILNHPNLGNPNLNMRNSDYNRIINRSGNRNMQMGIRFLF